jgi:hypothetical protein
MPWMQRRGLVREAVLLTEDMPVFRIYAVEEYRV